jgi:predicted transcriptional regulator
MTKTLPISVRLEPSVNEQLSMIASAYGRPKSWVIQQALNEFIATQSWQLSAIDEGLKAADEGRVVAHAEVEAWVKSWDASGETPMPECV